MTRFLLRFLICASTILSIAQAQIERPNILFCIADDATWMHFGAYGCDWISTPGFDEVAEQGLLFNRAYTPNAKCAPSRSCIITGRNSWELKEAANHMGFFPPEFKSYVEALGENGYFVGKTGKGWGPGVAKDEAGKNRDLAGRGFDKQKTKPPAQFINGTDYAGNFEAFLEARPEDQPFCFWYGGTEPHRAYEYGVGAAKGGRDITEIDHVPSFWPDTEVIRNDMLDYGYEIEYFDQHLVKMLDLLQETGELDNTLILVTADNGMPFPRIKGQVYEYSNHLPLAIMWRRGIMNPGRKIDDYVSFIDFAPTFLEIAGLSAEEVGMAPTTGRSLVDIFSSDKAGQVNSERDFVLIGKERHDVGRPDSVGYPVRGIIRDGVMFLRNYETSRWPGGNPETGYLNCDGSPTKTAILDLRREGSKPEYWQQAFGKRPETEMYQVEKDPDCVVNLAGNPEYAAKTAELEKEMEERLKAQKDPRMLGEGAVFDQYPFSSDYWDDFYTRKVNGDPDLKTGWVNDTDLDPDLKE